MTSLDQLLFDMRGQTKKALIRAYADVALCPAEQRPELIRRIERWYSYACAYIAILDLQREMRK